MVSVAERRARLVTAASSDAKRAMAAEKRGRPDDAEAGPSRGKKEKRVSEAGSARSPIPPVRPTSSSGGLGSGGVDPAILALQVQTSVPEIAVGDVHNARPLEVVDGEKAWEIKTGIRRKDQVVNNLALCKRLLPRLHSPADHQAFSQYGVTGLLDLFSQSVVATTSMASALIPKVEMRLKTLEGQVEANKGIAEKALADNAVLKDKLQGAREALQVERAERESEKTSHARQLAESEEKLQTAEAERDSLADQLKRGKELWAEEAKAACAEEMKLACERAVREFRESDRYVNFMDRMQKRGYMLAIKHVEERVPGVSFGPYDLHPNMDSEPDEVWQAERFCIYGKIPTDNDSDLEGDEEMTKDYRPKAGTEEPQPEGDEANRPSVEPEVIASDDEGEDSDQVLEEYFPDSKQDKGKGQVD